VRPGRQDAFGKQERERGLGWGEGGLCMGFRKRGSGFYTHKSDGEAEFEELAEKKEQF